MPFTFTPHETVEDPLTRLPQVHHRHNYACILNGGLRYYVQDGLVYEGGGGPPVSFHALPDWFHEQYSALSPSAREAVGLPLPSDRSQPTPALRSLHDQLDAMSAAERNALLIQYGIVDPTLPPEAPPMSDQYKDATPVPARLLDDPGGLQVPRETHWTCPDCDQSVSMQHKGLHIARHRRAAKAGR